MFRDYLSMLNKVSVEDIQRPNLFEVIFKGLPIKNELLNYSGINNNNSLTNSFAAFSPKLVQTVYGAVEDDFATDIKLKYKNFDLGWYVKSIKMPDSRISYEYNYAQRYPTFKLGREELSEMIITFYLGGKGENRIFFQKWMESIINSETGLMAFITSVTTDIEVVMYDRQLEPVSSTIFKECLPVALTEPQLDYDNNNQVIIFDVTFVYKTKTSVPILLPKNTNNQGNEFI